MDNFDYKKFLTENKLGPYAKAKALNENEVEINEEEVNEAEMDEMARTAGTGGAISITDAGVEAVKQAKQTGEVPEGLKASELAALIFLYKNKGNRVQKIDYAKEKGVPQPAVNPLFNSLISKELASSEAHTPKEKSAGAGTRPKPDIASLLGDLDI